MKKLSEKLKKIIIDNVFALVVSGISYFGFGYLMCSGILSNLQPLWFTLFFISFGVFMYNLIVLVKVDNLGRRMTREWNELMNRVPKEDNKE